MGEIRLSNYLNFLKNIFIFFLILFSFYPKEGFSLNLGHDAIQSYGREIVVYASQPIRINKASVSNLKTAKWKSEDSQIYLANESDLPEIKEKKAQGLIKAWSYNVEYKVALTPNDPRYPNSGQWGLRKISAPEAWDITTGISNVKIAIIDTGFKLDHPDLSSKFVSGKDFIDNDNDPSIPNIINTETEKSYYHGTMMAGVAAAATNNGTGVAGLDWGAKIMPLRACDNTGSCSLDRVAEAILYAKNNGANIINLSLGGPSNSSVLELAVNEAFAAGVTIVAATGNENSSVYYPAAYSNVIGVGATDSNDVRASFSNYGPEISVVAPGVNIESTYTQWNGSGFSDGYAISSGTSLSTPFVSGLASLILSLEDLTPSVIKSRIEGNADKVIGMSGANFNNEYGYGRINASKSLVSAQNLSLTSNLSTTPSTKVVGQELVANFTLKNNNSAPITLDRLKVDVRGGTTNLDITGASGITIGAGESINFSDYNNSRLITGYGSYTANVRILHAGRWHSISGGSQSFRINNFSASYIEVISSLVFNPNPSSTSGETQATFQLKNKTQAPIYFERIKIDVRSSSSVQDYSGYSEEWMSLEDYNFNQSRLITIPGSYSANIRVRVNGRWYTPSGNVAQGLTVRSAIQNLSLTSNLSTTPSTKVVGQELVANFTLKNNNSAPITLDRLKVDVRGGTTNLDITGASGITIGAGESINFSDYNNSRLITGYGSYTANVRILHAGRWHSISGGSQSFRINNFSASYIEVISSLVFNPNPSSTSGETQATFQLKNKTQAPIYFERIKIDVRSSSSVQDYSGYSEEWMSLEDYNFNQSRLITIPGSYSANIRVRVNGRWYTPSGNVARILIVN